MMTTKQSLALIRAHFEALNWGKLDDMRGLVAADFVWQSHSMGRTFSGVEGYRAHLSSWRTAFPDFWAEISHLAAGTHSGVCEYVLRGTHKGTLHLPGSFIFATRQRIDLPVCEVFHVEDGRLAQVHTYFDLVTLHRQLGLVPQLSAQRALGDGFIPPIVYDN